MFELLTARKTLTFVELRQTFTVNTGADFVYVNPVGALTPLYTAGDQARSWFLAKETFRIVGIGVQVPHGFTIGENGIFLGLLWQDNAANSGGISELSAGQPYFYVPFENFELSIDALIQWPINASGTKLQLQVKIFNDPLFDPPPMQISMIGVPASLNGKSFFLQPFIKIEHNFPLDPSPV
jgi:hypothetical protein